MYFTANGRALPCCIAPFSQRGYENYTLGDATQQTLREIWNGAAYQSFPRSPAVRPTSCRVRELRPALEPLTVAAISLVVPVITQGDDEDRIGSEGRAERRVGEVIVVDGGSRDATLDRAREAGAHVLETRPGYGAACRAGLSAVASDGKIVVFMDGDGSDDPILRFRDWIRADRVRQSRLCDRLARPRRT